MKGMAYNGWKHGLPDKFWSVTLDNFFDNPDEIREFGLRSLAAGKVFRSSDEEGQWPGQRSDHLYKIDEKLSQRMCEKILSCYFNLDFEQIFWNSFEVGIAPLVIGLFTIASVQIFLLGFIGEYVMTILTHNRKLPLVIEKERINF